MPSRFRRPTRRAVPGARISSALIACAVLGAAAVLGAGAVLAAPGAPAAAPYPSATVSLPVPPPAPAPTASGLSPDAPDPHPPLGGRDAQGRPVGGARLLSRGDVLPTGAPALPTDVTSQSFVLVDLDSGAVIAARDPHGRYQPASILKLLTTVTVLPDLPGNRVVTVGTDAAGTEGSSAGLIAGGRYRIDDLFHGLLMVSGNDSAVALADANGGVSRTVAQMNATALRLGAVDTFVQTPSGLDGWQQLTSAYDMALVLRAALDQPRFLAYEKLTSATLPAQVIDGQGRDAITLQNQNDAFADRMPGLLAAKIGFTDAAQHTFVAATDRGGRRLGVVFMRAQKYPIDQWQQAESLLEWGYALPHTDSVGELVNASAAVAAARPSAQATPSDTAPVAQAGGSPAVRAAASPAHASALWWTLPGVMACVLTATIALRVRSDRRRRARRRRVSPAARA